MLKRMFGLHNLCSTTCVFCTTCVVAQLVQHNLCGLHNLKLMSIVHKMSMKLESDSLSDSEFLDSLRTKAETLQRNQSVRNVDNTPFT